MANNPSTLPGYNGQTAAPNASYPFGSARNDAAPGDLTGTPRIAAEINDIMGFQQALLNLASITPSGSPDTALVSQYLQSLQVVSTAIVSIMTDLLAFSPVTDGQQIRMLGYLTPGVGSGVFRWDSAGDKTEHDGGITIDPDVAFYTVGNQTSMFTWYNGNTSPSGTGVFRRIFTGTVFDDSYGAITNSTYVFFDAFVNRKLYEIMLNNLNNNDFTFAPKDELVWIVGSVNVGRSDITVRHLAGCRIRGRYDDPPNHPGLMQAGHMFGFVNYVDPFPEGSNQVLSGIDVSKINYILDGEASTEFNAIHSQPHNNNVIAFFRGADCSVTGSGGIIESDHNGIAFDGLCVNPNVEVAYIKDYDDRAVTMKGTAGLKGSGRINIGVLSGSTLAGTVKESILLTEYSYVSVVIGEAFLNVAGTGNLVQAIEVEDVDIVCGYVDNAKAICRLVNSGSVNIISARYKDVANIVARETAGLPITFQHRKVSINNVVCEGVVNGTIYRSDYPTGTFKELSVKDCDFELATGTFTPYAGFLTASSPDIINFENNFTSTAWVEDTKVWNKKPDRPNTAVSSGSFVYDFAGVNGDNPYDEITINLTHSVGPTLLYPIVISLRDLALTVTDFRQSTVTDDGSIIEITTVKVGTSITFTASASSGIANIVNFSLSN